jgi:dynein heavy chain
VTASVVLFLQKARELWAEMLWANLNIQVLQEGIEGFLKALRKLPREVKNLPVGKILDEKMKEFRDSLPLFVDLKHEALRDRLVLHQPLLRRSYC